MRDEEKFMKEAIRQAKKAYALREVPIGCVIVYEGKIIARGYNRRNTDKNTITMAMDIKRGLNTGSFNRFLMRSPSSYPKRLITAPKNRKSPAVLFMIVPPFSVSS